MNLTVVYNPKSGSALPKADLDMMFKKAGITVDTFLDITKNSSGDELTRLAQSGATIAAIGGDGTIASVAEHVVNTPGILAPLPGGTLNHFTKDAGIDQNLEQAIINLSSAQSRKVDVATVNDRVFLNNSSIGIYPSSLRTREQFEDKLGKWPAAVIGSIRAFLKYRLYTITINGEDHRTPFLFVGNNDYKITSTAERTHLDQGKLSVYAITSDKRRSIVKLLFAVITKRLAQQDEFMAFTTDTLTIHTKHASRVNVSTDGEVDKLSTPLTYTSCAGVLTII
ncbi:sphingosine kinase [Candidatus Saccharibacteria bacterium]|nr:sphingosine kinase [Candidatus Saccharibacteria bacterium]